MAACPPSLRVPPARVTAPAPSGLTVVVVGLLISSVPAWRVVPPA
ncbi:MAG: hypothetical protein BWZ02_03276 [Lentisphaerae bacterium ADurb.BinA184]|nr:MAG: hypothetical protein BWZ02_03276 [Lentisphaerae bacterium ADurb.BinA184]